MFMKQRGVISVLIGVFMIVVIVVMAMQSRREGLEAHKSQEKEYAPRMGLPDMAKAQGSIPSQKQEMKMFPGVSWGNEAASESMMGPATQVPTAPSAMLQQVLGYLQPLGSAPEESGGEGSAVGAASGAAGAGKDLGPSADFMPQAGMEPDRAGASARGDAGNVPRHGAKVVSPQSALPHGIPKSQIPKGQEDLYILKTEVVPPVCPACPACPECPKPVCPKPDDSQCPPCPAPGRCPPSAFGCQRVPLYQNMQSGVLPAYLN